MGKEVLRVLIVEDKDSDAEQLQSVLADATSLRFEVERTDRLATTLRRLRQGHFDLVLLDLFLPESQGLETLRRVKARNPYAPIIALTRFDDEQTGINAVKQGAQDYLVKGQINSQMLERVITYAVERSRSEEALRAKTAELEEANGRLQEADRLKTVFLANMSHELRTPLNSIIGFTGIILQGLTGPISDEQREQLGAVKRNGEHLLTLINELLDLSKIEAGKVELKPTEFSLAEVIGELVASFAPMVEEKGVKLLAAIPEGVVALNDRDRLRQVLTNLVSNAVKFTEEGEVRIAAQVEEGGWLALTVADTGIGIRREDMEMLFVAFHQLDMSRRKRYQGTGLGLHLSRKLANLMGGEITAKSEFGQGSEFMVRIPLTYAGASDGDTGAAGRRQ